MKKTQNIIIIASILFTSLATFAHPTGNMITVGDNVLWSYINPIDDPNHKACIMIWNKESKPKIFIQSEYTASDFMLYNNLDEIYIIERRHLQTTQDFEVRVLKTTINTEPKVIWNWFKDEWRIGESGFFMLSDDKMVFGKFPKIYCLEKGKKPLKYFEFDQPINRIRAVENNQILLLNSNDCYLTQQNGTILKQWNKLIDNDVKNAPLNRNQIFDIDYKNGKLLFAYWGKRSFELIDESGKKQTIFQQKEPLTPHWVAFLGHEKLLFSSKLIFDGSTPKPYLVLLEEKNGKKVIWKVQ
ncbi:hypothetical protein VOI54_10810 [Tamlana sp. 2201CG12-4]|uniref:hypothetical protein n=1 Tax=Tamlana sp. 2201CG12-4 TaxID=3112582 RepID=UPI002DBF5968|nr:hypothetical protein [Tamlana sp. 2201CG12-4]MEC3907510.1 hypothetical protein [Tamlana sp. 2201CG12-4]